MKFTTVTAVLTAAVLTAASNIPLPAGVPRSIQEFREKHPYKPTNPSGQNGKRRVVTIRASRNDTDDVSSQFKQALQRANHGGTLYLPANETFIIGQPLDLTFLDDVHVRLDGEIKFTDDTPYWQSVAFTHPFQNTIMFWKWGGKNVKIYGDGTLNGNGQRWWKYGCSLEHVSRRALSEDRNKVFKTSAPDECCLPELLTKSQQ